MSFLLGIILAVAQAPSNGDDRCVDPSSKRDVEVCKYLDRLDEFEIRSVESVAVGTNTQMLSIRPQARKCGLTNRIDYVGSDIVVFDIINADETRRDCLVSWINANKTHLKFSEEKLEALIQAQNSSDKGLIQ